MLYVTHMHNEAHSDNDLIPTAVVAEAIGRTVSTVNRMVARGEIAPAAKVPGLRGAYLFRRSDIDALVAQRAS